MLKVWKDYVRQAQTTGKQEEEDVTHVIVFLHDVASYKSNFKFNSHCRSEVRGFGIETFPL